MKNYKYNQMKEKKEDNSGELLVLIIASFFLTLFLLNFVVAVPDTAEITSSVNTTKSTGAGGIFNISGGYLSKINLTATIQNPHWKAFLGWVQGKFTLDDSSGSTIYDWNLTMIRGQVYSTRNSSIANWGAIVCANVTTLTSEDVALEHSSPDDNITATFGNGVAGTHPAFSVGNVPIADDSCPAINTYRNNVTQSEYFFEMALYDGASIIYATRINRNTIGYDGNTYDFQMIVPENGNETWTGATAYYIYVELV